MGKKPRASRVGTRNGNVCKVLMTKVLVLYLSPYPPRVYPSFWPSVDQSALVLIFECSWLALSSCLLLACTLLPCSTSNPRVFVPSIAYEHFGWPPLPTATISASLSQPPCIISLPLSAVLSPRSRVYKAVARS